METKRNDLREVIQLLSPVQSLIGGNESVKCIVDKEGNYELTTDGLKYIRAVDCKHWAYHIVYEDSLSFNNEYGYDSASYLFYVGRWCHCFLQLLDFGIPSQIITAIVSELIEQSLDQIRKNAIQLKNVKDLDLALHGKNTENGMNSSGKNNTGSLLLSKKRTTPNPSLVRSSFVSKYSRHAMKDMQDNVERVCVDNEVMLTQKFCSALCGRASEVVQDIISDIITTVYKDYTSQQTNHAFENFTLDSKRIIIEPLLGINQTKSEVYSGIVVPCTDWYILNSLRKLTGSVSVALINTIAYGDVLPSSKDLKINEVITGAECFQRNIPKNMICNVTLILYRGEINEAVKSELNNQGILFISITSYSTLFNIATMLSCDIHFGFDNLNFAVCCMAKVSVVVEHDQMSKIEKRIRLREKNTCYHVLLQNDTPRTHLSCAQFHSLILCDRTVDLYNILSEKVCACLKKIDCCLRNKSILKSIHAESKIMEHLNYAEECSGVFVVPHWLEYDVNLYRKVVCQHVSDVFECYMKVFEGGCGTDDAVDDVSHRIAIWRDSLGCAIKVLSTLKTDLNF